MGADREMKVDISPSRSRQLDFDPQSFVNVGSWLSSQEKRPTTTSSTQTSPSEPSSLSLSPKHSRLVVFSLLALVGVLLGTNAYSYREARAWKVERSVLQKEIAKLERAVDKSVTMPKYYPDLPSNTCPGGELIDTCWFKVGFGHCAKEALGDPVGRVEGAWRVAWDSTADVIDAVGQEVMNDIDKIGMGLHSFGKAVGDALLYPFIETGHYS